MKEKFDISLNHNVISKPLLQQAEALVSERSQVGGAVTALPAGLSRIRAGREHGGDLGTFAGELLAHIE